MSASAALRWLRRAVGRRGAAPAVLAALAAAAVVGRAAGAAGPTGADGAGRGFPARLSQTGLYADPVTKRVAPENLPFAPQYPLWSDGATKRRWIRIPPGRHVDGSRPDAWRFPVGTRFWKEFSFAGRRAETRIIELRPGGRWAFATYAWDATERDAVLVPEAGIRGAVPIGGGVHHDLPAVADCHACHDGRTPPVLGFTRIQLSPDRDPLAPHVDPPEPGSIDLAVLTRRGLLRGGPPGDLRTPPRIPARSPVARAALGYLQANCGGCHNAQGPLAAKGLALDFSAAATREEQLPAFRTAVGQRSRFGARADASQPRIAPGDPDGSVVVRRIGSVEPLLRMPPLGTKVLDEEALALVRRWIREDLAAGAPPAGEPRERSR